MNKQEAIERLGWNVLRTTDFDRAEDVVVFEKAKEIISLIDQPQKVMVPKFVALRIERYKDSNKSLYQLLDLSDDKEFNDWFLPNGEVDASRCDVLARAWLDGYEIEQEKLYVVNLGKIVGLSIYLRKTDKSLYPQRNDWSTTGDIRFAERLTEQEIKQKDERLWQFRKEVE
ncbi:DUF1642 domain-containing protein [Streptococcus suis]|nr:DUF1642 domain-containing protein [Streptococcus suis]